MVVVFYDFETTHLDNKARHRGVQIVSIGAVTSSGKAKFKQHILPTIPISKRATEIHGLYKDHNGQLCNKDGDLVDSVNPREGLNNFKNFLNKVCNYGKDPVILVRTKYFFKAILYTSISLFILCEIHAISQS